MPDLPDSKSCTTVSAMPTAERAPPQHSLDFSMAELSLAFRCHGMPAETLRQSVTPLGMHYLLMHFDVPLLTEDNYTLAIGGRVLNPFHLTLDDVKSRPSFTQLVTMECAGTGRHLLTPRPVYVSWGEGDIGTYQWTGTPLRPLLEEAGLLDDAVEILFTGWDSGVDLGVEHAFERSMPVADALRPEVMLAWAANGQPLLPVHGFPLRLIVPSWYGMASVKWLRSITALREPFKGVQQMQAYRFRQSRDEAGEPVREKRVMSVMLPPGVPDLISQCRFVAPGQQQLEGKAWSGSAPIAKVEVSVDAGKTWVPSLVTRVSNDPNAWVRWQALWDAAEGDYTVMCRATDAAGNVQPDDAQTIWNVEGNGINSVRSMTVFVRDGVGAAAAKAPCTPREILPGAKVPPVPQ